MCLFPAGENDVQLRGLLDGPVLHPGHFADLWRNLQSVSFLSALSLTCSQFRKFLQYLSYRQQKFKIKFGSFLFQQTSKELWCFRFVNSQQEMSGRHHPSADSLRLEQFANLKASFSFSTFYIISLQTPRCGKLCSTRCLLHVWCTVWRKRASRPWWMRCRSWRLYQRTLEQ